MIDSIAGKLLSVNSTIAFAALVLACLGVANVIAANIHSRRFEYGVFRAVGAQRGTVLRLILGEAMLIAVGGAVTGSMLGIHLARMGAGLMRDLLGLEYHPRWHASVALFGLIVMIVLCVLAALPAAVSLARRHPRALLAVGRGG